MKKMFTVICLILGAILLFTGIALAWSSTDRFIAVQGSVDYTGEVTLLDIRVKPSSGR